MFCNRCNFTSAVLAALFFIGATPVQAQVRPDSGKLISAQQEAMKKLAAMDGVWRGVAWTLRPGGDKHTITQTERIGPMLDNSIKVIEGRGYDGDGKTSFNAFGVITYSPDSQKYTIHSTAMGQTGDFPLTATDDGYQWEIQAGPVLIRYTAVIKDGTLTEVGDRLMAGKEPMRFFEMKLNRISDTTWPAANPIPPK